MLRLLMLDSGAFSVWSKGRAIDLTKYIAFCQAHPDTSYYVNLDVIPGVPNNKRSITKDEIERSAKAGWDNYRRMIAELPLDKVVPVFHMNEDPRWLTRYLEFGTPYIGISPANDRTTPDKLKWLRSLRGLLFDGAGRPVIKTHGFAVTSYRLMQFWQWHSVDSASWMQAASFGGVYMPHSKAGQWDYNRTPLLIAVSPKSPSRKEFQMHYTSLSPGFKAAVDRYFVEMGATMGASTTVPVAPGYKLKRKIELWFDKTKQAIQRITEPGLSTCPNARRMLNAKFMQAANEVLPVDHIYFAGTIYSGDEVSLAVERQLGRRLMSYYAITGPDSKPSQTYFIFQKHLAAVAKQQSRTANA